MATYAELLSRITNDYLLRPDLAAETRRATEHAIRQFEARRFWFNEATSTLTCSAGQTYVSIPSDFLQLDKLEITIGSARYELAPLALDDLLWMRNTDTQHQPTNFCYYADQFELAPIPDSAYSLPIHYIKTLGSLSDNSSVAWTNEASDLIAHTAAMIVYRDVLRDGNGMQLQAAGAAAAYTALTDRNMRVTRGKLRATRF